MRDSQQLQYLPSRKIETVVSPPATIVSATMPKTACLTSATAAPSCSRSPDVSYNAIETRNQLATLSDVDAEALVNPTLEARALATLPAPQPFRLDENASEGSRRRAIPSRARQDIARRNATTARRANAEHTARRVQELGSSSSATSANANTPSAAERLQALRNRIAARQTPTSQHGQ